MPSIPALPRPPNPHLALQDVVLQVELAGSHPHVLSPPLQIRFGSSFLCDNLTVATYTCVHDQL